MRAHAPALPHGAITEIFPDVFFVTGSFRIGPGVVCTRNMTVVRQGRELVVLNSVRLTPEGEAQLDRLGKVSDVVRVGAFHGIDDPYYVERYGAKLWGPPKVDAPSGISAKVMGRDGSPVQASRTFVFEQGQKGEIAVVLDREGGLLVTCDAFQNWTSYDGCSLLAKPVMRIMGFEEKHIGGPWAKAMGPGVRADFDRLLEMPFRHLAPAHGTVLRDLAKDGLREAMTKRYR